MIKNEREREREREKDKIEINLNQAIKEKLRNIKGKKVGSLFLTN